MRNQFVAPLIFAAACLLCGASSKAAEPIFKEDFQGYSGGQQNAAQVDTRLPLSVGGNLPHWEKSGQGTVHAVNRDAAGDYAAMIWIDNVLTLAAGIDANERGKTYEVAFDASPAVYAMPGQATSASDGMVIDVLDGTGRVVASHTHQPGEWKGSKKFATSSFQYDGVGSGAVRLRIRPLANEGRFGGAIDNLSVSPQSPAARHFDRKIAPLLASHCLECHNGPAPKGELDLSTLRGALAGGESGAAIVPGELDESYLWERIEADEMPPKHRLTAAEKELFKNWIRDGAVWGKNTINSLEYSSKRRSGYDWWSLQPLKQSPPPEPTDAEHAEWPRNEIDKFILSKLEQNKLSPSPRADARTLVRRVYVDLIGLPPSPEVVEKFAEDPSPKAWAKLVDGLLASGHYGERWARHWLDIVRFGESHGFEYNGPRETAWHYRDWVIRSLNDDLPFDEFARMQLAGDAIMPDTLEGYAAAGFLVAGVHNGVVGASAAMKNMARQDELEDLVGTIGQTFLGLTVNCARCHDHKFDPISTEEYYQFVALVAGVNHGEVQAGDKNSAAEPVYSVVSSEPPPMRVHVRGSVTSLGKEVPPGVLRAVKGALPPLGLDNSSRDRERRTQLAQWITDPRNGPFLRVIVNRVWQYHFGIGIVDTPSDLGFNGARPSNAELLDWLAVWFRQNNYSLKRLHKLIVTSAAYQQSSRPNAAAAKIDADNRLLWRQNARRVEAEALRDSILDIAGQLNREPFGPGYRDVRIEEVSPTFYYLPIDPIGKEFNRRTIYRWSERGQRSALLDTFDCPDPSAATPKRNITTTPSQALSQWNDSFVVRMSQQLAERVTEEVAKEPVAESKGKEPTVRQVDRAWRLVVGRLPTREESIKAVRLVRDHDLALLCRVLLNSNEFILID